MERRLAQALQKPELHFLSEIVPIGTGRAEMAAENRINPCVDEAQRRRVTAQKGLNQGLVFRPGDLAGHTTPSKLPPKPRESIVRFQASFLSTIS